VRKADNLPPSCAIVTKSGNLNFLEPSGPLRACKGTALSFHYKMKNNMKKQKLWFAPKILKILILKWTTTS